MELAKSNEMAAARRSTERRAPGPESAKPSGSDRLKAAAGPKLKMQIDLPGSARLGPGKVKLLEMIDTEGSLSKGARAMKISYRRAWLFVHQINEAFDEPAVATPEHGHGGGPARLTPFGKDLIRRYRDLEKSAARSATETITWLGRHLKPGA